MTPSRRGLSLCASLAVAASLVGCGGTATSSPGASTSSPVASTAPTQAPTEGPTAAPTTGGKLVFVSPGGTYAKAVYAAYLQPFENETGIQIEQVEGGDDPVAAVKSQVTSGNVLWDVISCSPPNVVTNPGIWEPIDYAVVTSRDQLLYPEASGEFYVQNDVETFPVLAYSTKAFPNGGPQSWADFFDVTKFPGPRGLSNVGLESAWLSPAIALLADGVTPDKLLPFDLDRAYAKLDQLKPDIRAFWTTFSGSQDVLRSGEVVVNVMTDGRALQLINAGSPVAVSYNQAFRNTSSWCTPKGAPDAKNAMILYEYILAHPKQQAIFTSLTGYGPPTKAGVDATTAYGVKDFSSKHIAELIPDSQAFQDYIKSASDELLNRWNAWVAAQ